MADITTLIHNAYFENDECDKVFFYTGKSNVKGLHAPDYVYYNDKNYLFQKILDIQFEDMNSYESYEYTNIDEEFESVIIADSGINNRVMLAAAPPMKVTISIKLLYDHKRKYADGILFFRQSNFDDYMTEFETYDVNALSISGNKLSRDRSTDLDLYYEYIDEQLAFYDNIIIPKIESKTVNINGIDTPIINISIWFAGSMAVNNGDAISINDDGAVPVCDNFYICTNILRSLALENMPMNGESSYPSTYSVEYLNNKNVRYDENVTNTTIEPDEYGIVTVNASAHEFFSKFKEYISSSYTAILNDQYIFSYDPVFVPTSVETIVPPTSTKANINSNDDYSMLKVTNANININEDIIEVYRSGVYELQLKNGFYLIRGETRLDINVYINGELNEELSLSMYLTSNGEEDARKAIKNTISSPTVKLALYIGTEIAVKVIASNPDNIVCENETKLLCTLVNTVPDIIE